MIRLSLKEFERLETKAKVSRTQDLPGAPVRKRAKKATGVEPVIKALPRQLRRAYEDCELVVEISLDPKPKERARTFIDQGALVRAFVGAHGDARRFAALVKGKGRDGEGGIMRTVTPETTRLFEEAIKLIAGRALAKSGLAQFGGPVEMDIDFRFEGDPGTWPTSQADGDLDNLEKAILDGLKPIWLDDRLVVKKTAIKQCAAQAGVTVRIRPATP